MSDYHVSVLLKESVDGLNIKPDGTYVDVTFGGGGHSKYILDQLGPNGRLFAFDQDADAQKNLWEDSRLTLIPQNFRYLKNSLRLYGATKVDGVLADLGVSSHQFDAAERGFSTRFNADLDMRMNQSSGKSAKEVVNGYEEADLKRIFWAYGELKNSGRVAGAICSARSVAPITTIEELKDATIACAPKFKENRFFAQLFQAIRIEVNEEMEVLKELLEQSIEVLSENGRLSVISYHSLEDRLVKHFMRYGNFKGQPEKDFYGNLIAPLKPINRKPIIPDEEEIVNNSRARSAKLRVSEKV